MRLLAYSKKQSVHVEKSLLLLWCKKVETSCALAAENKDSSPAKGHCMGVCAVENSMLFNPGHHHQPTQITGREGPGVANCGFKAKGVVTQSETGNTANDISGGLGKCTWKSCRENELGS